MRRVKLQAEFVYVDLLRKYPPPSPIASPIVGILTTSQRSELSDNMFKYFTAPPNEQGSKKQALYNFLYDLLNSFDIFDMSTFKFYIKSSSHFSYVGLQFLVYVSEYNNINAFKLKNPTTYALLRDDLKVVENEPN